MDKELFDFVAQRVDVLATSQTSKQDTQEAAQAWKNAVAADDSEAAFEAATAAFLDVLEPRMVSIDEAIAFAEGPAKEYFGEEAAAAMLASAQASKADGWKFCNCEAHVAAGELLGKFGRVEL